MSIFMKVNKSSFILGLQNSNQVKDWFQKNPEQGGLVFLGRSNVGKSTLINQLFLKGLARVSKTPGRTQEINVFDIENTLLFDCPGMGHAKVPGALRDNWEELMLSFFEFSTQNHLFIHLMDARHPFMPADLQLLDFLKKIHINPVMVFCKIDKLKSQKERHELKLLKDKVIKEYKKIPQIHFISAVDRIGTEELKTALLLRSGLGKKHEYRA